MKPIVVLVVVLLVGIAAYSARPDFPDGPEVHTEPEPTWGLGVDTSRPLRPGPFMESEQDREHLRKFFREWWAAMSAGCPGDFVGTTSNETLERAFSGILNSCLDATEAAEDQAVADVGSNFTRFKELADSVAQDLRRVLAKMQAMPPPGTYVDAAFQLALVATRETQEKYFQTAGGRYQDYVDHQGEPFNEGNLLDSVSSLVGTAQDLRVLEYAVDHYQWQAGTCQVPDLASEASRIWTLYNETVVLGAAAAPARYANNIQNPHGVTLRVYRPSMENYTEDGFVLGLMGLRDNLAYYRAYWENYTADPLPTQEEARYLFRLKESEFRSYATEVVWMNEFNIIDQEDDWDRDAAVRALAIGALTWTFEDLQCTGPLP